MKQVKMMYQFFEQAQGPVKIYLYDNITAQGEFNWDTLKYDESETSAKYLMKILEEIPDERSIELHINSYGGDVKEGVAIYNILKQKKSEKICYIDCFAYSVAYVIALACDKIIMGLGSSIMVHNMWTVVAGNAEQLRKEADDLDILMESNRKIFLERINIDEKQLEDMMKQETILGPEQCLDYGFCDEINTTSPKLKNDSQSQFGTSTLNQRQPNNSILQSDLTDNQVNKSLKMVGDFFNIFYKTIKQEDTKC